MFCKPKSVCVIASLIAIASVSSSRTFAQTSASAIGTHATLSMTQLQMLKCVNPLLDASDQRFQAFLAADRRLSELAIGLVTIEGGNAFREAALGVDATLMLDDKLRPWLQAQFVKYLFPVDVVTAAEQRELKSLDADLAAIDDQVLVQVGVDADLADALAKYPKVQADFSQLDRAVSQSAGSLLPVVKQAQVENFAVFEGGFAAGSYAGEAAADAMRDDEGRLSAAGYVGSFLVDMAADAAVTAAAGHLAGSDAKVRRAAIQAAQDLVHDYIAGAPATQREQYLVDCVRRHDRAVFDAVVRELGVDRDWACEVYNKALQERFAAKK